MKILCGIMYNLCLFLAIYCIFKEKYNFANLFMSFAIFTLMIFNNS